MHKTVKIIDVENIGRVCIKKTRRARNIRISINPYEPVTISAPHRVSDRESIALLKEKETWIIQQLDKISRLYKKPGVFSEATQFKTLNRALVVQKGGVDGCKAQKKESKLIITYPKTLSVESVEVQDFIRLAIAKTLRGEASVYLPDRVFNLAKTHNFSYRKVFIKNSKSRWGSCSSVNNINLNFHLICLPPHLSDYIILHELVHTVEKNHGKQFWAKLGALTGDAKKLRKELGAYSHLLYGIYREQ